MTNTKAGSSGSDTNHSYLGLFVAGLLMVIIAIVLIIISVLIIVRRRRSGRRSLQDAVVTPQQGPIVQYSAYPPVSQEATSAGKMTIITPTVS